MRWDCGGGCVMYYWGVSKAVQFAKEQTAKAASVKALQEIAKEMAAGKGYEIGADAEIFAKYGELCKGFKCAKVRDNKPHIWCIYSSVADYRGRVSLSVICVR